MSDGWGAGNNWGAPEQHAGGQPDWATLAEQHEQKERRRKQLRVIGGAVAATVAVGGITATAVVAAGSGKGGTTTVASAGASPSVTSSPPASAPVTPTAKASASASPSAARSTPADPLTLISAAATDTAPLNPDTLFAATLTIGGKTWTRLITKTDSPCWQATTGHLGDPLTAANCRELLRATYTSGTSAVTIGVAVLDSKAQADAAIAGNKGQIQGLVPDKSIHYCVTDGCASTHNAVGRYAYYTVQGTTKPGGNAPDATANAAAPGLARYTHDQLLARGSHH